MLGQYRVILGSAGAMQGDTGRCWVAGTALVFPSSLLAAGCQRDREAKHQWEQAQGHREAEGVSPSPVLAPASGGVPGDPPPLSSSGLLLSGSRSLFGPCPTPGSHPCCPGTGTPGAPSPALRLSLSLPQVGTVPVPVPGTHPALALQAQRDAGDIACGPCGGEWSCWGHNGAAGRSFGGRGVWGCCWCSPGIGGSALPAPCPAQGLPVPQVTRLETLLKFGLWLFGVPWANSECCPHPVPFPHCPGVTPFTSCSPHRAAPDWHPPAHPAWPPPAQPPAFAAGGGCHHCPLTPLPLLSPVSPMSPFSP